MQSVKKILGHLLIWVCVPVVISFIVWIFFRSTISIKNDGIRFLDVFLDKGNILNNFIILFCGTLGFYIANHVLAPYFLRRENIIRIILGIGALLLIPVVFITAMAFFFEEIDYIAFFIAYPVLIFFSIAGALFRVWVYSRVKELENAKLEQKTLETQLNLLKTQINPHFLFNTINNIDVLIENNPKVASDYLRKLGDLLRFMLYRVNEMDMIPLEDEIEYLKKYIDLQKIRSINPKFVDFTIKGDTASITVAPMVFIVFVENAFKHVADKKQNHGIVLCIEISAHKVLFKCRNTVGEKPTGQRTKEGGIGLASVERRLDLVYKDNYELNILSENGYFEVILEIELP